MTCRQQAGLSVINIQIKFEVSNYTHCEAVQNREFGVVRGHSRSSAMLPFDGAHTTSYWTLIETVHLCCIVFEM